MRHHLSFRFVPLTFDLIPQAAALSFDEISTKCGLKRWSILGTIRYVKFRFVQQTSPFVDSFLRRLECWSMPLC